MKGLKFIKIIYMKPPLPQFISYKTGQWNYNGSLENKAQLQ